jgi:hypothetical protein
LTWVGFRIEPHWVSKDPRRFLCNGQLLSNIGEPTGRWKETRVLVGTHGSVQADQKRFLRRNFSNWTITAESPDPPRRRAVFLLRGNDAEGRAAMMALRLPATSRAVPILREALADAT